MLTLPSAVRYLCLATAICGSAAAENEPPLDGNNLATGRSATFSFAPNYQYSAGNDETDLFDGKHASEGFWTSKETVGWLFGRKAGVLIRVDLGSVSPIGALSFNTAAGSAQVTFPAAVFVFASDDGQSWYYVTDLINEPISQAQYVRHRFAARDLKTRGRHLAFYVAKGGFYAFVDEIEVIEGSHRAETVMFEGPAISTEKLEADANLRAKRAVQKNITLSVIQEARSAVSTWGGPAKQQALRELDRLRSEAVAVADLEDVDYSRGLPYGRVDTDVCRTTGSFFSDGSEPVSIWQSEKSIWSHTNSPFIRADAAIAPQLHADMMIGEYEPVAFNISNNRAVEVEIHMEVDDLKSTSGEVWLANSVDVRATSHVVGSGYLLFDDALPPVIGDVLTIPPGMTRQLWLILNSDGVRPDEYHGGVTVRSNGQVSEVPLTATVYPVQMPENPPYTAQSWCYFTWLAAKGFEQQASAELRRSYTNAHVLHHYYIPWPKVDPETKKLIRPIELDFTRFDEMLAHRPYVKQWLLWPGLEFGYFRLNYFQATDAPEVGTPAHGAVFREWVRQIRDHLQEKGLGTDRWAFYWIDEPGDEAFLEKIVPASRMAKEVDPSILVWEDHQVSLEVLKEHPDAIDIHSCPLSFYLSYPAILNHVRAQKYPGVHYLAGGSKGEDPHRYYRLHHMASLELGLNGAGLWVWGDDGGQFNDYLGEHPSYGMVYATENGPLTGKRREAWREGIEDVELWRHLRVAAKQRKDAQLLKLSRESPSRLTKRSGTVHKGSPAELMQTRLEILKALSRS